MAGLAGALLAAYLQLATPGLFGFAISLSIFAMVIFGGMANLTGTVLGAAVVVRLDPAPATVLGQPRARRRPAYVRLVVYGMALLVI